MTEWIKVKAARGKTAPSNDQIKHAIDSVLHAHRGLKQIDPVTLTVVTINSRFDCPIPLLETFDRRVWRIVQAMPKGMITCRCSCGHRHKHEGGIINPHYSPYAHI